ncbi:MAG: hypoxanthine phosphoribosyltransferase [Clostridia bacterium]|nr:hypoxanthine phosphoribosyltransferase [Clostridia bacterium]
MNGDIERIIYDEKSLAGVVERLAGQINADYQGKELVVIGILKGSAVFLADLFRKLECSCTLDFMAASRYGSGTVSKGKINITKDLTADIRGKNVLIVEDILDTGNTLSYLKEYLQGFDPESVKICVLFVKPSRRTKDISADYIGYTIDDLFLVGYGLDYDEKYRNLPYVGLLKSEIYQ